MKSNYFHEREKKNNNNNIESCEWNNICEKLLLLLFYSNQSVFDKNGKINNKENWIKNLLSKLINKSFSLIEIII